MVCLQPSAASLFCVLYIGRVDIRRSGPVSFNSSAKAFDPDYYTQFHGGAGESSSV